MFRRIDCRKYWRWKRQQESKSKKVKRKVKKRKRKDSVTDCIDNVEQTQPAEVVLKVSHPKYKKEKKIPWLLVRQPIKRVPLADLLLKSIKPSMEIREYFHNPRHVACLQITSMDINVISELAESATSLHSQTHIVDQIKDRKKWGSSVRRKTKDDENEERIRIKKLSRKEIGETESENESDCKSICSSDSEISLTGMKLTSKDKKEIKKYQSQGQSSSKKGED